MDTVTEPDWGMTGILGAARGARLDDDTTGTQHLLAALAGVRGTARAALTDEGVTKTAVFAVLRAADQDNAWSGTDTVEQNRTESEVLGESGEERITYTGAAAKALTTAMELARQEGATKFSPVHLLRALLAEDNHATEMLARCGATPEGVLSRLDGGPGTAEDDDLDALLHPTRDALLGRVQYRHMPFWRRTLAKWSGVNWASRPGDWVRWETYEQARRRGDKTVGTEHVLLAVLATHEVAARHPHLTGERDIGERYSGGERLARQGVDYVTVHRALSSGAFSLPADARSAERYLDEATATGEPTSSSADPTENAPPADPGTGPVVESLLREDTRARHLVERLTGSTAD